MLIRLLFLFLFILPLSGVGLAFADSVSLKGQFLVAAPSMSDTGFTKTVILILEHDENGAMGLIINRVMGSGPLDVFLQGFGVDPPNGGMALKDKILRLHYGGPVGGRILFVIHSLDDSLPGSNIIFDGIAVSTSREVLVRLANAKGPARYLMVSGYSGWGAGQLEGEIEREDWVSAPADAEIIFTNDPEAVWDKVFKGAGLKL